MSLAQQRINPAHAGEGVLVHLRPGDDFHVLERGVRAALAFPLLAWGTGGGRKLFWRGGGPSIKPDVVMGPDGGAMVGDPGLTATGPTLDVTTHFGGSHQTTYKHVLSMANIYRKAPSLPEGGVKIEGIAFVFVPKPAPCVTALGDSVLGLVDVTTRNVIWPYSAKVNEVLDPCAASGRGPQPWRASSYVLYLNKVTDFGQMQTIFFEAPAIMPDFEVQMTPRLLMADGTKDLGMKTLTMPEADSANGYYGFDFGLAVDANTGTGYLSIKQSLAGQAMTRALWQAPFTVFKGLKGLAFVVAPTTKTVAGVELSLLVHPSVPTSPPALPLSPCEGGMYYVPVSLRTKTTVIVPLAEEGAIPPGSKTVTLTVVPWPSDTGRGESVALTLPLAVRTRTKPVEVGLIGDGSGVTVAAVEGDTTLATKRLSRYGSSLIGQGKGYYRVEGPVCAPPGASFTQPPDQPLTPPAPAPGPSGGGDSEVGVLVAVGGLGALALAYAAGWL